MLNRARQGIAGVSVIAIVMLLAAPETRPAEMAELLRKLDLSTYPRATKPPEFSGRTVDGRTVSLASLQGKVVILNFWATWCKECLEEMPAFEQLHRKFAGQGLTVLAINAREGTQAIQKYGKELSLTFPLIVDPKGEINSIYGVVGLPTTFLIGRDGHAVARGVGPREWGNASARAIVQMLLGESVVVKKPQ
jgi:peroxiredoxin